MSKKRGLQPKKSLRQYRQGLIRLFPLKGGVRIPGGLRSLKVPANVRAGTGSRMDATVSFKQYRSRRATGLKVGKNTLFLGTHFSVGEKGEVSIGDSCYIAEVYFLCEELIRVGNRVVLCPFVSIADADFHPLDPVLRAEDAVAIAPHGSQSRLPFRKEPVIIEDDVWIGFGATILKGLRIGRGAIVGAGSVVTHDIERGMRVAGNPARVISPA